MNNIGKNLLNTYLILIAISCLCLFQLAFIFYPTLPLWAGEILFFMLPAIVGMSVLHGSQTVSHWNFLQVKSLLEILVLSIIMTLLAGAVQEGISHFLPAANPAGQAFIAQTGATSYRDWNLLLKLCVIPAVSEEFLFRGFLLPNLNIRKLTALSLSAGLFASAHFNLALMPALFILGFFFGWVRLRFGLQAAVLAHLINNYMAVVLIPF